METAKSFLSWCNEILDNERYKAEMESEYEFRRIHSPTNGLKMGFIENSPFGLVERVYAAKKTNFGFVHMEIAVIPLEMELPIVSRNCYYNYYGIATGFYVYGYDGKGKSGDYYRAYMPYMEKFEYSRLDNDEIKRIEMYDYEELERLDPKLKYSHYQRNNREILLREYIALWKQFPICEMLMKCKIFRWFEPAKLEKLTRNKNFQKWVYRWRNELSSECISFSYAHNSFKKNPDRNPVEYVEEIQTNRDIANNFKYVNKDTLNYLVKFTSKAKALDYVQNNHIGVSSYIDYLTACRWLQLDFKDTKVLFPKDFITVHDDYTQQYNEHLKELERKAEADKNAKIKEAAERLSYLHFEKDGFIVIIPETKEEFIVEGNQQNNCVGRMHYDDKVIAGTSAICFVRKVEEPEKSFATVEIKLPELKIVQFYGYKNKNIEDAEDWKTAWIQNAKKIRKAQEVKYA